MHVVQYEPRYKPYFIRFNTEWITTYFGLLEDEDHWTFEHLEELIDTGAMVFFAIEGDDVLACCMAMPVPGTEPGPGSSWEICKLGSTSERPHAGAGSLVFGAAMRWALDKGAGRLQLVSNTRLGPALGIYEKFGFRRVELDDYGYSRGDIAFEFAPGRDRPGPGHHVA